MRLPVALAAAFAALGAAPAGAATSISLYSDPGDFIGEGRQRVFTPANTTQLGAKMDGDAVLAYAVGGGDGYSFEFAAPPGQRLEPRNYVGVQRLPFREPGHAGMEVTGNNHGCNALGGRFELRDLVHDGAGNVQRLWVVFEQHCDGDQDAAWGEVRIDAPSPSAQERTAPGTVRWPPLDDWRRPTDAFVTYVGSAPVEHVAVEGADFQADGSACVGRAGPCDVMVRFAPGGAGTHQGVLRITDTAGGVHETALEGFTYGGVTSAQIEVTSGDVASPQPGTYSYDATTARFGGRIFDTEASIYVEASDGRWYEGRFGAGGATPLHPGTFGPAATDYASGPWMRVLGSPLYCNATGGDFAVHEVARLPEGDLRSLDVSFDQQCYADHRLAHRGRLRYRAGSTAPLAAWMEPGPRPVIPVPASGTTPPPGATPAPGATPPPVATPPSGATPGSAPGATPAKPRIRARFGVTGRRTRIRSLVVDRLPSGATVRVRCGGRRCPFARRAVPIRDGRATAGRRLRRAVLRPGMVLEVQVRRDGRRLARTRYEVRAGRGPLVRCGTTMACRTG